jgi:DNA-directed RNA polymerase II subunit RPB2
MGTAFSQISHKNTGALLERRGYQKFGNETLYNGHTGEPLKAQIFIGVAFYQRLKHLVQHKMFSRSRGPVQQLVRQPTEGRAAGGGLRLGEMERDCFISHGVAAVMKDRFFFNSDPFSIHVCNSCGLFAIGDFKGNKNYCKKCSGRSEVSQISINYSTKLLFQELMAMNIAPRLQLEI